VDRPSPSAAGYPKTAACACGALTVGVTSRPKFVHACTCLDCQRMSGSALSYTAFFPEAAAEITGPFTRWRRVASSGRWIDSHFCPTCGGAVFARSEGIPGLLGIAVGCFAEPDFQPPANFYWSARRHRWLIPPDGAAIRETQ